MSEKRESIVKNLQDAKNSSELVLLKVSELLEQDETRVQCNCACHNTRKEADYIKLQERVSELEVGETRKNDEIFQLKRSIHELKEVVYMLQHQHTNDPPTVVTENSNVPHYTSDRTNSTNNLPRKSEKQYIADRREPVKTGHVLTVGYCTEDRTSSASSGEENDSTKVDPLTDEGEVLGATNGDKGEVLSATSRDKGEVLGTTIRDKGDVLGATSRDKGEVLGTTSRDKGDVLGATIRDKGDVLGVTSRDNGEVLGATNRDKGELIGATSRELPTISATREDKGTDQDTNQRSKGHHEHKLTMPSNVSRNVKTPTGSTTHTLKPPLVLRQTAERRMPKNTWMMLSAKEQIEGSRSEIQLLDGVHTILLIDISESMADAWSQVQTFVYDYLNGLEELETTENFKDENVALVVYGHATNITRSTKDIQHIRREFDAITLGGPSPMFGGIMMAVAVAQSHTRQCFVGVGQVVPKRVVLISDFNPTETELTSGPDIVDFSRMDETLVEMLEILVQFRRSGKELICVPVGQVNTTILEHLTSSSEGRQWSYLDGRKFARRYYVLKQLMGGLPDLRPFALHGHSGNTTTGLVGKVPGSSNPPMRGLTPEDMEIFKEASADLDNFSLTRILERENIDRYLELDNSSLPRIGSRVRRGPDWRYPDQDGLGPGTVIGHTPDGSGLQVEWDVNEQRNVYRYGQGRHYDVLLVDEARVIGPSDNIAVGCLVVPGSAWRLDYNQIKRNESGVVIKKLDADKVQVKWTGGHRGDYTYRSYGPSEVTLPPIETAQPQLQHRTMKNKNLRIGKR